MITLSQNTIKKVNENVENILNKDNANVSYDAYTTNLTIHYSNSDYCLGNNTCNDTLDELINEMVEHINENVDFEYYIDAKYIKNLLNR